MSGPVERKPDPRNVPADAYAAFMAMPQSEWLGLCASLASGGILTPAEQEGFDAAIQDRKVA